jgi:PAS domain S-box-containing protein
MSAGVTDAQFASILAIAADAIISVDESHSIIHFNRGAEEIFGYDAAEVIGKPLNLLIPDRYRAEHPAHMQRFAGGPDTARRMGQRREIFGLRKGGIEFPAEASISKVGEPGERIFTVVLRDISDRRRIEQNQQFLAEAGALLSSTLEYEETLRSVAQLPVPHLADYCVLHLVDDDRRVRRITSTNEDRTLESALREAETTGVPTFDSDAPSMEVLRTGDTIVIDHEQTDREARIARLGLPAALGVHSAILIPLIARQRVSGAMSFLSRAERAFDATDVQLAQDVAQRSAFAIDNARAYAIAQRANRAREEVLSVVSHDLRNPLSAIAMCSRVLMESPPATAEERNALLATIAQSTELTNRLIEDLLDLSMIEAGRLSIERRPEDIAPIVEHIVQMFAGTASERSIALYEDVSPDLPTVVCDAGRVVQALANLLGNALKFTEAGGRVTVSAEQHEDGVVVSVSDTGFGIPAEHQSRIFERYWQARGKARIRGSGLGLAIAKGIVEAHGGRIWVKSTLGEGSTFSFTLRTA